MRAGGRPAPLSPGPRRSLTAALFARYLGTGVWTPLQVLFFVRIVDLPTSRVVAGLTVASLVGLLAGPAAGRLADRFGPREVGVAGLLVQAAASAALLTVRDFTGFVVVIALVALGKGAFPAISGALIAHVGGEDKVQYRARLYSLQNLAMVSGSLLGGIVLQLDSRTGYTVALLADMASYLLAAVLVARLGHLPPHPQDPGTGTRKRALADRPFVAVSLLAGVLVMFEPFLAVLMPVWIAEHTQAPRWTISLCFALSSVLVVVFQSRVARGVETPGEGARALRRSGPAIAVAVLLVHAAAQVPQTAAVALLLAGTAVLTAGEMVFTAGEYAVSFGLAPAHAQGEYQGVFGLGTGLGTAVGPPVLSTLCLAAGPLGWIALCGVMVGAGAAVPRVVRLAERDTTERAGAAAP
ncbi:MFS transporter [Streptomyces eurythermus]|uniref:MFS transporter n=1 Tax=Streptomyces eurythermus TaxID=42237 RepID=UPI0036FFFFE4